MSEPRTNTYHNPRYYPPRICNTCRQIIPVRLTPKEYSKRLFCSNKCRGAFPWPIAPATHYKNVTTDDGRHMSLHRHLMEKHVGRKLETWEHVHHKNENKLDNRLDNLELTTRWEHGRIHNPQRHPDEKVCEFCGAVYIANPKKRARQKTCSEACRWQQTFAKQRQFTCAEAEEIRHIYAQGGRTQWDIARQFNTTQAVISRIIRREGSYGK